MELDRQTGELIERPTLARLTEAGRAIRELMLQEELDQPLLQEALTHVEGPWLTKVENIGMLLLDWEKSSIPALKAEIDRLTNARRVLENRIAWLKQYTLDNMISAGETELQFPLVKVSIAKNPPSVVLVDEGKIPVQYLRTKEIIEVDKQKIMAQYKENGAVIPGCAIETDKKRLVVK